MVVQFLDFWKQSFKQHFIYKPVEWKITLSLFSYDDIFRYKTNYVFHLFLLGI